MKVQGTLILGVLLFSLCSFKLNWCRKQGIEGYLYKVSGNQMPSPDQKPSPPLGIKDTLYIYELTNTSQVIKKDASPFYSSIATRFVKWVVTNNKGYFKVKLPVGKYSLFVKKDTFFYSNRFDSQNNIAPVEVLAKKMIKVEFRVDYGAVY